MADYGISVTNNSNSIMITGQYKIMVFSERGTFRIQSQYTDREGSGSVTFAKPILSQEPPQIFLKHVSGAHSGLSVYTTLVGGPGNWTGFRINSAVRGGSVLQNYLMEFVACKYADKPNQDPYGMSIWDGSSAVLFNSADKIVRYSKFAKAWTLSLGSINTADTYNSNLSIDADDFISVSSIDRGVVWFADGATFAGLTLLVDNAPVLGITINRVGGGYWYYQGINSQNFCIPVCKFPTARYYN